MCYFCAKKDVTVFFGMMNFSVLPKLVPGDRVAILSPSFAAPAAWPEVFELGLERMRDIFGLEPVLYPTTSQLNASTSNRAADIMSAFSDTSIKAIFSTIGGDDQVLYAHTIDTQVLRDNPKMFWV